MENILSRSQGKKVGRRERDSGFSLFLFLFFFLFLLGGMMMFEALTCYPPDCMSLSWGRGERKEKNAFLPWNIDGIGNVFLPASREPFSQTTQEDT